MGNHTREMPSRKPNSPPITYQDAGVSIDEADRAVSLIRQHARGTFTRSVLTDIGSFGGGYLLSGWKNPVLVSSADGVGTKVLIAQRTGRSLVNVRNHYYRGLDRLRKFVLPENLRSK